MPSRKKLKYSADNNNFKNLLFSRFQNLNKGTLNRLKPYEKAKMWKPLLLYSDTNQFSRYIIFKYVMQVK